MISLAAQAGGYDWLTIKTLPAPSDVLDAAMKNLPKTLSEKQDWLKRLRRAAWYPQLGFEYKVAETVVRDYNVVDRVERTTASETERTSSRDSSSQSSASASAGSETVTDGGGVLTETRSSSGGQTQFDTSSGRGSSTSSRSINSTTLGGPDSFATGEDLQWANEFGVFLTWDLSRLVFQDGEIDVLSAEIERETFRQTMKTQIILTYYDLMEAILLLDNASYRDSIPTIMRRERQAFLLDELTGGFLSASHAKE